MTINTKWFTNTMAGAPGLSGSVGAMIAVLDACLINGFNLVTLDSLVVASNVATGSKAAHGYVVNQVVEIAGASTSGLNGTWRVASVTSGAFTFATTGISDQTATGTITAKTPGVGFEKQFSGTNLGIYRSGDMLSSRQCIKVDDTVGQYSTVAAAESYTDISTPVNAFATHYFKKSNSADAGARNWIVIADNKTVYIGVAWNNTGVYDLFSFGDFDSAVAGDAANFRLQGLIGSAPATFGQYSSVNDSYTYAPNQGASSRAYSQIIAPTAIHQGSMSAFSSMGSATSWVSFHWALSGNRGTASISNVPPYASPAPADNGYHFVPVYLFEQIVAGLTIRGQARGLMHLLEYLPISSGYSIVVGVENVPEGLVLMVRSAGHVASGNGPIYQYPASVVAFRLGAF